MRANRVVGSFLLTDILMVTKITLLSKVWADVAQDPLSA